VWDDLVLYLGCHRGDQKNHEKSEHLRRAAIIKCTLYFVGTWQLKEINGKGILPPLYSMDNNE